MLTLSCPCLRTTECFAQNAPITSISRCSAAYQLAQRRRLNSQHQLHRQYVFTRSSPSNSTQPQEAEEGEFEGLTPEEDWVVPGGYEDSLSSNTELGRAVRSACDELESLGNSESEVLTEADALLKKLGLKKGLFDPPKQPQNPAATEGS